MLSPPVRPVLRGWHTAWGWCLRTLKDICGIYPTGPTIHQDHCLVRRTEEGTDFHNHDRLLNYIADSCIDQVHEHVDATFRRRLNLDRTLPDRLDALPNEINIDFRGVPSSSHQSPIITYYQGQKIHTPSVHSTMSRRCSPLQDGP